MWEGSMCELRVDWEDGFTLSELPDTNEKNKSNQKNHQKVIWKFSYNELRTSADDSNRLLWLDFGSGGNKVSNFFKI